MGWYCLQNRFWERRNKMGLWLTQRLRCGEEQDAESQTEMIENEGEAHLFALIPHFAAWKTCFQLLEIRLNSQKKTVSSVRGTFIQRDRRVGTVKLFRSLRRPHLFVIQNGRKLFPEPTWLWIDMITVMYTQFIQMSFLPSHFRSFFAENFPFFLLSPLVIQF